MTEAAATDMQQDPDRPVFRGTPEDWWDEAEEITESHAAERTFGNWYITMVRNPVGATPAFRVATPSKPPNDARRFAMVNAPGGDPIASNVRLLIRSETPVAAWMTSEFVLADLDEGSIDRGPWRRMNNGRWQRITDGRISVNDHTMRNLNPKPARFS